MYKNFKNNIIKIKKVVIKKITTFYGGNMWESNSPMIVLVPQLGFEDL